MSLKTILAYITVAAMIFFVIENPHGTSHLVHNIGTWLTAAAAGLSHFFTSI
jgi:hypothetical protein